MNNIRLKLLRARLLRVLRLFDVNGTFRQFLRQTITKVVGEKPIPPGALLESADVINFHWPENIEKPKVGLVEDFGPYASSPKYERFLSHNKIPFEYYDIHKSSFFPRAKDFDLIIWRTGSSFADQYEAKSKIEFLEKELDLTIFPSASEIWFYEDKVRQQWLFQKYQIPTIKSFVSFSQEETLEYLETCNYPIVSKEATNSGSEGVYLIKNKKQAVRFCNKVFGPGHRTVNHTYFRQKDYVLFQEYIRDYQHDLRVIIIGSNYFGYYREVPKGDFRASGAGILKKEDIPNDALYFAKSVKEKLPDTHYLSVDMLKDRRDDQYYVIEVSLFNRVSSSDRLVVNGIPGKYVFKENQFKFFPGRVWIQELVLIEFLNSYINKTLMQNSIYLR
jgi:glutathione synthase/RimK-type ligase-like ATP-grasp enzyme